MASPTEIVITGMSTELWGQRFYREAAARTESEDGKRVFESLVEEEGRHLDMPHSPGARHGSLWRRPWRWPNR